MSFHARNESRCNGDQGLNCAENMAEVAASVKGYGDLPQNHDHTRLVTWNGSSINLLFRTDLAACTLIPNAASRLAFQLRTRGFSLPSHLDSFVHRNMAGIWLDLNLLLDATLPLCPTAPRLLSPAIFTRGKISPTAISTSRKMED